MILHLNSDRQRQIVATLLGLGLMLLLLVLIALDDQFLAQPPEQVVLREVRMHTPPPPPPPPPTEQQASESATPSLSLAETENQVVLDVMELEVELDAGGSDSLGTGMAGIGEGLGMDWGMVGFSELDGMPMVVNSPVLNYPEVAIERNVDEFRVLFHIMIDEEGRTHPVRIVENPFPELEEELKAYASQVRFSPPKRLGVPVRTEYLWPVLFTNEK